MLDEEHRPEATALPWTEADSKRFGDTLEALDD
jgi:hypothetical protein